LQYEFTQTIGVSFAHAGKLDDLARNDLGDWIAPIGQTKVLQHALVIALKAASRNRR
jgi:hypothetical protein